MLMSAGSDPSVSVAEILHLALPGGAEVLAGEAQLSRRVTWARLVRARTAGLSSLDPSELLILPPGLLESQGDARIQVRLVDELVDAGAAALITAGPAPIT